jgi:hypothetical protein
MEIKAQMLFQWQVVNALLTSRWPSASFYAQAAQAQTPTTHWNMSSFGGRPDTCFNAQATQAPQTYPPSKHVTFQ